jgi:hypothetical protein
MGRSLTSGRIFCLSWTTTGARRWLQRVFLAGRVDELRGVDGPHQRVFDLARTARA